MQELTLAQANDFLEKQLQGFLEKLSPDTKPNWGQMTAQHMVEHLAWIVAGSARKWKVMVVTPDEKLPRYRLFVYSNIAIKPNFSAPMLAPGELPALKLPDMAAAIEAYWSAWADFEEHFKANPTDMPSHPLFGPLSSDEWRRFHFKHSVHHLTQFGVTTLDANGLELPAERQ